MDKTFDIIVAMTKETQGIGMNGKIPWRLPTDMKFFSTMTTTTLTHDKKNACIMGRKTYFSIPPKFRPLPNRINIVLSRDSNTKSNVPTDVYVCESLDDALQLCKNDSVIDNIFIIGGSEVYKEALQHPQCKSIYITLIHESFDCDVFFPPIDETKYIRVDKNATIHDENNIHFEFIQYQQC